MYVSEKHKKIVLNLRQPERVLTTIPSAKTLQWKGKDLVAVPHRIDEVTVLNNLGVKAPSPIRHYYDWPASGGRSPFKAQLETAAFLTLKSRAFVLNDLGTGKTLATLWAYDYLKSQGRANKMLVASPLSTLERTWADEVFRNFPHLNVAVLHGSREKRLKLLASPDIDVYVVNHDGVKIIGDEVLAREDIDVLVIDELATFRNQGSDRYKAMAKLCTPGRRVWGLTGTPTPHGPTDAWAQCKLIAPENVPKYFGAWRDQVMQQLGQFKWIPRAGSAEIVRRAMQPAIRFTRDECVDLPPCMYEERHVALTAEQNKAYQSMLKEFHAEYESGQVTAVNAGVKMNKLLQICCGAAYATDGEVV